MKELHHRGTCCLSVLLQFLLLCTVLIGDLKAKASSDIVVTYDENELLHLRWRTLGEGVVYRFQMAADKDFKQILVDRICDRPEITVPCPATAGQYYVRTKPKFPNGQEGKFSQPQQYKVRSELPPPLIVVPREIEEYRGIYDITVRWSNVPRASGYHVMLARDRNFQYLIHDAAKISGTVLFVRNLDFGTYYLKISSIARDGTEGDFSDIRPFMIVPPRPAQGR